MAFLALMKHLLFTDLLTFLEISRYVFLRSAGYRYLTPPSRELF